MLIRQSLNFAAHFAAGLALGGLIVAALARQRRRRDDDMDLGPMPEAEPPPPPGGPGSPV